MRTRSGGARAPKPASSPATRRELRPRQASRGRGLSAGGTTRRAAGRVTRSSAALSQTNPNNGFASHKRSLSPSPVSGIRRAKRLRRRSTFYGEGSDSEDAADSAYISQDSDVEQKASPRRTRKIPGTGPEKRSPTHAAKGRPDKIAVDKSPVSKESKAGGDNAVIPNWPSLPYMILLDIFRCAAASLSDQERAKWLPAASGVCQAFAEPALTALYQCPPLLTRSMAHGLVSALSKDPTTMTFNYRNKVEELWIDVQEIASKTYRGQHLNFDSLITNLPNLKFIQFFHLKDQPPYRELDASLRWRYPATLFQTLNSGPTKLAGWQWNRRLMGPELDVAGIKAVHQTRSFAGLRKLSLLNYQVPSLHAKESADDAELAAEDHAFVRSIADAIQALPTLEHLAVEASTAINYQLLPLLPKSLVTLELVNCWEVKADDFASYLLSSGYRLQHLILHHNQSLSLAFLTVLGTACPDLRTLSMDFKTFNHHEFYRDSEPNYDDLLTSHQIPVWPENLEKLELKNLKKWTAEGAETLFQSLVDSAPKLLKLRSLDIKAMLNIPYRQRSELRDKWDAKLKQVFLRDKQDPLPFFSLRQPPQQAEASSEAITKRSKKSRRRSATAAAADSPSRRSTRLALQRSLPPSRDSSVGLGRDLRNGLGRPSYVEPDTDTDMDEEDGEGRAGVRESDVFSADSSRSLPATTTGGETLPFRHGMCDKVEFQLDNQKPAEKTYVMEDFLDDEADDLSDDDWTGDDDDLDNGYAW